MLFLETIYFCIQYHIRISQFQLLACSFYTTESLGAVDMYYRQQVSMSFLSLYTQEKKKKKTNRLNFFKYLFYKMRVWFFFFCFLFLVRKRQMPLINNQFKKYLNLDFHDSPMVKMPHFHCRGMGSAPGWETKTQVSHSTPEK